LHRLLRALATIEICRELDDGAFEITPMGTLLRTDAPQSLRSWTIWWAHHLSPVWDRLLDSVKTGRSARALLAGTEGFAHLDRDPDMAALFNRAMAELTRLTADSVVQAYGFSGLTRIVDVGGGYGELLAAILTANRSASGVLFDLPHAIAGGRRRLEEAGLAGRCEFVAGDFFEAVPGGGDAYVLKHVIHDWNDEHGARILESCRGAMASDARLLLVEQILPDRLVASSTHRSAARSDLTMLVAHAAGERTEAEFRRLLGAAGFRVARVVPAGGLLGVIEALPRR